MREGGLHYRVSWEGTAHDDEWVPAEEEAWTDGTATAVLEAWQAAKVGTHPTPTYRIPSTQ